MLLPRNYKKIIMANIKWFLPCFSLSLSPSSLSPLLFFRFSLSLLSLRFPIFPFFCLHFLSLLSYFSSLPFFFSHSLLFFLWQGSCGLYWDVSRNVAACLPQCCLCLHVVCDLPQPFGPHGHPIAICHDHRGLDPVHGNNCFHDDELTERWYSDTSLSVSILVLLLLLLLDTTAATADSLFRTIESEQTTNSTLRTRGGSYGKKHWQEHPRCSSGRASELLVW